MIENRCPIKPNKLPGYLSGTKIDQPVLLSARTLIKKIGNNRNIKLVNRSVAECSIGVKKSALVLHFGVILIYRQLIGTSA